MWSLVKIILSDNILTCNCQKNNTWVWIQDHPKIIKSDTVTCLNDDIPKEKCNVPVISQLSVDKHKDNSVSVSWFIRNRTAIKALQILYYSEDVYSEVGCFQIECRLESIAIMYLVVFFYHTEIKTVENEDF